jgi:hypothetical protein
VDRVSLHENTLDRPDFLAEQHASHAAQGWVFRRVWRGSMPSQKTSAINFVVDARRFG